MLPVLARTTGSALARNLMGGKKKVAASAVRPTTSMVPQRKSGALDKQPKPSPTSTKPMAPLKTVSSGSIAKDDYMGIIHSKVIEIEGILKGTLAAEKEELRQKRKQQKDEDRANQEKKLEAKDDKQDKKGIKMPKVPEVGIFGWIKRFVGNVLLGIFFSKLVDFAPALTGFIKAADGITTFLADVGIKLVDGLATFVDWGYKAYDATQGFLENFGVGQEQFDQFSGAVSGMIDALIIGSVILAARGEDGLGPGGLDKARKPAGRRPGVTQGRGGQPRGRFTNPFRRGPRVTQSGGPRRPGAPVTQGRGGQGTRPRFPGRIKPRLPGGTRPTVPSVGGAKGNLLLSLILAPFEFFGRKGEGQTDLQAGVGTAGSTAGGFAGMQAGGALGAKIGAFLGPKGALVGAILGGLIGGIAGSVTGGAAADKLTGADKVGQYQEGGRITKSSKIKRGIKTKKKPKKLNLIRPTKENLRTLPPPIKGEETENQERAWWDFLGWAGTGQRQPLGPGGEMLAEKVTNVGNTLGRDDFFGPILKITSKVILDQELESTDYQNVGRGINLLINQGIKTDKVAQGAFKYQEGGEVFPIKSAIDAGKWVEDAFKTSISKDINRTFMSSGTSSGTKYGTTGPSGPGSYDSPTGAFTGSKSVTTLGSGGGSLKDMSKQDFSDLAFIVSAEAARNTDDEYGVAAAVLNRVADPRFPNTIMGVGTAPGQFEAVYKGLAVRDETLAQKLSDNQGKIVEALKKLEGRTDFKGQSQLDNKGDTDIMFSTNGNFYHYLEQVGKTDPVPSNVPQDWKKLLGESTGEKFTPTGASTSVGPVPNNVGTGMGSEGEEIAGKLGDFMKANRSKIGVTGSIHQWLPRHSPKFTRNYKSYHNENRALDIGGWSPSSPEGGGADEQAPVIAALIEWNKKNKYNPVQLIHGSPAYKNYGSYRKYPDSHHHHVHVAYEKGGMTLDGPHLAMLGEKGKEIVIDNDSSVSEVTPMLLAINQAKNKQGVLNAIRAYAPYDSRANQVVVIEEDPTQDGGYGQPSSGGALPVMMGSMDDPFEFLDYQG